MHEYSPASWYAGGLSVNVKDSLGVASTPTLTALEAILDATRPSFRLTYNQVNSGFYTDFTMSSTGILTVAPTGTQLNLGGNTIPTTNNIYTLGTAALRWSGIYAGLGDLSTRLAVGSTAVTNTAATGAGSTFAPARLLNVYQAADLTSYAYVAGLVTGLGVNESAAAILGPYSNNCLVNWKLRTGISSSVVVSTTGGATVTSPDEAYQPVYNSTRFRQNAVMAASTTGDVTYEFSDPGGTFITHVAVENFFTPFVQLGSTVASFSRISNIRVEYRLTGSATWNILFNAAPTQVGLGFWRGPNLPSTANVTGVRFTFSLLASSSDVRIQEIGWATPYLPQGAANFGMLNAANNWGQPNTVLATLTGTPLRQVNLAGAAVVSADAQGNLIVGSGAGGAFNFEYRFSTNTAATAPGDGYIKANVAVPPASGSILLFYIAAKSNTGKDLTDVLTKIKPGDKLYLQDRNDNTKSVTAFATQAPVLQPGGTWFIITTEIFAAESGVFPANNQVCDLWVLHTGTGTGTANYLARWLNTTTLGIGTTQDDGAKVSIGGALDAAALLKVYGAGWFTGNLKTDGILTVGLSAGIGTTLTVGTTGVFGGMVTATDFTDSNLGTNDVLYSTAGLIQGRSFAAANIPTVPPAGGTPNTLSMFGTGGKSLVDSLFKQEISASGAFARWTGTRQYSAILADNSGVSGIDPHYVGFAWMEAGSLVYTAYTNMTAGSGSRDLLFNYFDTATPTPNLFSIMNFRAANQTVNFANRPTVDQGANPRGVATLYMTGNPTSMYSVAKFMAADGRLHNSSIIDDGFTIFAGEPIYVNPGVQDIDSIFRLVRPAGVPAKFDLVRMKPPVFPEVNPTPVWRWSFGATAGTPSTDPMPGGNPTPGFVPNEPGYFYFNRYDNVGNYAGQMFALGPTNLATFNCPVKLTPYQIHSGTSLADFESEAKVFRLSDNKGWFGPEWNNNPVTPTDSFLLLRLQGITGTDILQCTNTGNFAILCPLEDQGGLHIGKRWTPAPNNFQVGMMVVEQARDTVDPDYNQIILTFFKLPQPSYAAVPGWEELKSNQIFAVTNKEDILMSRANETETLLPPTTDRGFFYMNAMYSPGGPQGTPTDRGYASTALIFNLYDGAVWGFDARDGYKHWIRVSGVSGPATGGFVPRMLNQYKVEDSNIQDSTLGTAVNSAPIPTTTLRVAKTWSAASAVSTMSVESTHATSSASQQQGLKVTPLASHTVGTLTALAGVSVDSQTIGASGTTADQYGFLAYGSIGAGALVTRRYGFRAQALSTGAVGLANYYGVWVDDQGATTQSIGFYTNMGSAVTKWGIFSGGLAQNHLRGNVGIGLNSTAPAYELDVVGNIRFSSSVFKSYLEIPITDTTHNGHWIRLISGTTGATVTGFTAYLAQTKFRIHVYADGVQSNRGQIATVTVVASRATDDATLTVDGVGFYNGSTPFITSLRVVKDNTLAGWFVDAFIPAGGVSAGKTDKLRVEILEGFGTITSTLDPSLATGTVVLTCDPTVAGSARTYSTLDAFLVTGQLRATESITAVTSMAAGTLISAGTTITAGGLVTGAGLKDTTLLDKLLLGTNTSGQLIARTLVDVGAVGGSGTEFVVPRWDTGGKTLRDSVITDASTLVTVAKNTQVTGTLLVTSTGTFNNVVTISMGADPRLIYMETGAPADKKRTDWMAQGGAFFGRFYNDALNLSSNWMLVTRMASGYQADTITFNAVNGTFATLLFSAPSLYTTAQVSKPFVGTDATGKIVPASLVGGTTTPTAVGTVNVLPRWNVGGATLGDSGATDDNNTLTVDRRLFTRSASLNGNSGTSSSQCEWYQMSSSADVNRWYLIATFTPGGLIGTGGSKAIFEVHCGQYYNTSRSTYHVEMGDRVVSGQNEMKYYVRGEGAARDFGAGIQVYRVTGGTGGGYIYNIYAYTQTGFFTGLYVTAKNTGYNRGQVAFFPNPAVLEATPGGTMEMDTTTVSLNWSCFGYQASGVTASSIFRVSGEIIGTETVKAVGGLIDDSLKSKPLIGTDSIGRLQAFSIPGGGSNQIIGGLGVADYVARWTDVNILGTGLIRDNSTSVSVGGDAPSPSTLLFVRKNWTAAGGSYAIVARSDRTTNESSSGNVGVYSQSVINHPSGTQVSHYDFYAAPTFGAAGVGGTTTDHYGYRTYVLMNGGTVVTRYGFAVANASLSGGNITNEIAFFTTDLSTGINRKGYVSQVSAGGGTRWNIYAEGSAPNYFNGNVGIGYTGPLEKIQVSGNAQILGTISAGALQEMMGFAKDLTSGGALQSWKIATMPVENSTGNLSALAIDMECQEWATGSYPGKIHLDIQFSSRGSPAGTGLRSIYHVRGTIVPTVVGIRVYQTGTSPAFTYVVYAYLTGGTYAGFTLRARAYGSGTKTTLYHTPVDDSTPGPVPGTLVWDSATAPQDSSIIGASQSTAVLMVGGKKVAGISGNGTVNVLPRWANSSSADLVDSGVLDDSSSIGMVRPLNIIPNPVNSKLLNLYNPPATALEIGFLRPSDSKPRWIVGVTAGNVPTNSPGNFFFNRYDVNGANGVQMFVLGTDNTATFNCPVTLTPYQIHSGTSLADNESEAEFFRLTGDLGYFGLEWNNNPTRLRMKLVGASNYTILQLGEQGQLSLFNPTVGQGGLFIGKRGVPTPATNQVGYMIVDQSLNELDSQYHSLYFSFIGLPQPPYGIAGWLPLKANQLLVVTNKEDILMSRANASEDVLPRGTDRGFFYINVVEDVPTGVPTARGNAAVPLIYNKANDSLYGFNGTWRKLGGSFSGSSPITGTGTVPFLPVWVDNDELGTSVIQSKLKGATIGQPVVDFPTSAWMVDSISSTLVNNVGARQTVLYGQWLRIVDDDTSALPVIHPSRTVLYATYDKNSTSTSSTSNNIGIASALNMSSNAAQMGLWTGFYSTVSLGTGTTVSNFRHMLLDRNRFNYSVGVKAVVSARHGIYIDDFNALNNTTLSNNYGIQIINQTNVLSNNRALDLGILSTGGGTRYNIYAGGDAQNYFLGKVGIGVGRTTPAVELDVAGDVTVTGTVHGGTLKQTSLANAAVVGADAAGNLKVSTLSTFDFVGIQDYAARWTDADSLGTGVLRMNTTTMAMGTAPVGNVYLYLNWANTQALDTYGILLNASRSVAYAGANVAYYSGGTLSYPSGGAIQTTYYDFLASPSFNGTGTTASVFGIRINTSVNAGTVNNRWGIFVTAAAGAGTIDKEYGVGIGVNYVVGKEKWNLYANGTAPNYFAGTVTIGNNVDGEATGATTTFVPAQLLNVWRLATDQTSYSPITGVTTGLTMNAEAAALLGPFANNCLTNWKLRGGTMVSSVTGTVTITTVDASFQPTLTAANRYRSYTVLANGATPGTAVYEFTDPSNTLISHLTAFNSYTPYLVMTNHVGKITNLKVEYRLITDGLWVILFNDAPTFVNYGVWRGQNLPSTAVVTGIRFTLSLPASAADCRIMEMGWATTSASIQGINMFGALNATNTWGQTQTWTALVNHFAVTTGTTTVNISGPAASSRVLAWQTLGVDRWKLYATTGDDLYLLSYTDAGAPGSLTAVFQRSSGSTGLGAAPNSAYRLDISGDTLFRGNATFVGANSNMLRFWSDAVVAPGQLYAMWMSQVLSYSVSPTPVTSDFNIFFRIAGADRGFVFQSGAVVNQWNVHMHGSGNTYFRKQAWAEDLVTTNVKDAECLKTDGTGKIQATTFPTLGDIGGVGGSGTVNILPRWDVGGKNLVNSGVTDDGSTILTSRMLGINNLQQVLGFTKWKGLTIAENWKIATMVATVGGTGSNLEIDFVGGGYTANLKNQIRVVLGQRESFAGQYQVFGISRWPYCGIRVYQEANLSYSVYVYCAANQYSTFAVDYRKGDYAGAGTTLIANPGPSVEVPTGTLIFDTTVDTPVAPQFSAVGTTATVGGKNLLTMTGNGTVNVLPKWTSSGSTELTASGLTDDATRLYVARQLVVNPSPTSNQVLSLVNAPSSASSIFFIRPSDSLPRWTFGLTAGNVPLNDPGYFYFNRYKADGTYDIQFLALGANNKAQFNCPVTLTPYQIHSGSALADNESEAQFFRLSGGQGWFGHEWNNNPDDFRLALNGTSNYRILQCNLHGSFAIICPTPNNGGLHIGKRGVPNPASGDIGLITVEHTLANPVDPTYTSMYVTFTELPPPPYASVPSWKPLVSSRLFAVSNKEDICMSRANIYEEIMPIDTDRGFFYINAVSGIIPTGTPTPRGVASVPLIYNKSDNNLYAYNSGWKKLGAAAGGGSPIAGAGTQHYLARWDTAAGDSLGNSVIQDNGTGGIGIGTTPPTDAVGRLYRTYTTTTNGYGLVVQAARSGTPVVVQTVTFYSASVISQTGGSLGAYADYYAAPTFSGTITIPDVFGYRSLLTTTSGTVTSRYGFAMYPSALNGGAVGTEIGFWSPELSAGINRIGFKSSVAAGAGTRWNFYADGLAPNYFNGPVGIKKLIPTVELDVVGSANITGTLGVTGVTTLSSSLNVAGILTASSYIYAQKFATTGCALSLGEAGSLMHRVFGNSFDAFQFTGIVSVSEWSGSAWVTHSQPKATFERLFTGQAHYGPSINLTGTRPKIRFVLTVPSQPSGGSLVLVQNWVANGPPSWMATLEFSDTAAFTTSITAFASQYPGGVSTAGYYTLIWPASTNTSQPGYTYCRLTLESAGGATEPTATALLSLQYWASYSLTSAITDVTRRSIPIPAQWNYGRQVSFDKEVAINSYNPPTGGYSLEVIGKQRITDTIVSAAAQGTAPISVTSTTLCPNLNAQLLNGYQETTLTAFLRGQFNMVGGGTLSATGAGSPPASNPVYVKWTTRIMIICNGYSSLSMGGSYFSISMPTSGTITVVGGAGAPVTITAEGIPLVPGNYDQLYAVLTVGGAAGVTEFRIVRHTSPAIVPLEWVRIAASNADLGDMIVWFNGERTKVGQSVDTAGGQIQITGGGTAPGEFPAGTGNVANYLPVFTSATSVGNSLLTQEFYAGSSFTLLRLFPNSYGGAIVADSLVPNSATGFQWAQNNVARFTAYLSGTDAAREMIWTSFNAAGTVGTPFLKFGNDGTFNFLKLSPAAPFTVASNVLVPNLNTDLWDGLHESSYTAYRNAGHSLQGGGVLTVTAAGAISWSSRIIAMGLGRGAHWSTTGFFDITMPTVNITIPGYGGALDFNYTTAAGVITLPGWHALYYELPPPNSSNTPKNENFRITYYLSGSFVIPYNWVLIAERLGELGLPVTWFNKERMFNGETVNTNTVGAKVSGSGTASTSTTPATATLAMFTGTGAALTTIGNSYLSQEDNSTSGVGILRFTSPRTYGVIIANSLNETNGQVGFQWAQNSKARFTAYTDGTTNVRDLIWSRLDAGGTVLTPYQIHRWASGEIISYAPFQSMSPPSAPTAGFFQSVWRDALWYDPGVGSVTGAICLNISTTAVSARFLTFKIKGFYYGNEVGGFELLISCYAYSNAGTATVSMMTAKWMGDLPTGTALGDFKEITFRRGTNEIGIVLGTGDTVWPWFRVMVSEIHVSHQTATQVAVSPATSMSITLENTAALQTRYPVLNVSRTVTMTKDLNGSVGTANYTARWTAPNILGTGLLQDTGSGVGVGVTPLSYIALNVAKSSTVGSSWGLQVQGNRSGGDTNVNAAIYSNSTLNHTSGNTQTWNIDVYLLPSFTGTGTTSNAVGVRSYVAISAGIINNRVAFQAVGSGITGTGAIGAETGFECLELSGTTGRYAFKGSVNIGAGSRWNLYMDGTALNYLNGNLGIKKLAPTAELDVVGSVVATGSITSGFAVIDPLGIYTVRRTVTGSAAAVSLSGATLDPVTYDFARYTTAGTPTHRVRWRWYMNPDADLGITTAYSDSSNLNLYRYSDDGNSYQTVFEISRASGNVGIGAGYSSSHKLQIVGGTTRFTDSLYIAAAKSIYFWDANLYQIGMNQTTGGSDPTGQVVGVSGTVTDYNMIFNMGGGTTRGFVWKNGSVSMTAALMQLHPTEGLFVKDGVHTFEPTSGRFGTATNDVPIIWRNLTAWFGPTGPVLGAVIIRINFNYFNKLVNIRITGHNHTMGGGIFEITAGGYTSTSSPYWGGSPRISWSMNLAPTGSTELKRVRLARHSSGDWGIVLGQVAADAGGATSWTYGRVAVSEMLVSPRTGESASADPTTLFSTEYVTSFTGWAFEASSDADVTMVKPSITAVTVTGANSVRHTGTNTVALDLVGDMPSPGVNKYYGTDGSGNKSWYPITGGTGTTIVAKSQTFTILSTLDSLNTNSPFLGISAGPFQQYFPSGASVAPIMIVDFTPVAIRVSAVQASANSANAFSVGIQISNSSGFGGTPTEVLIPFSAGATGLGTVYVTSFTPTLSGPPPYYIRWGFKTANADMEFIGTAMTVVCYSATPATGLLHSSITLVDIRNWATLYGAPNATFVPTNWTNLVVTPTSRLVHGVVDFKPTKWRLSFNRMTTVSAPLNAAAIGFKISTDPTFPTGANTLYVETFLTNGSGFQTSDVQSFVGLTGTHPGPYYVQWGTRNPGADWNATRISGIVLNLSND